MRDLFVLKQNFIVNVRTNCGIHCHAWLCLIKMLIKVIVITLKACFLWRGVVKSAYDLVKIKKEVKIKKGVARGVIKRDGIAERFHFLPIPLMTPSRLS